MGESALTPSVIGDNVGVGSLSEPGSFTPRAEIEGGTHFGSRKFGGSEPDWADRFSRLAKLEPLPAGATLRAHGGA